MARRLLLTVWTSVGLFKLAALAGPPSLEFGGKVELPPLDLRTLAPAIRMAEVETAPQPGRAPPHGGRGLFFRPGPDEKFLVWPRSDVDYKLTVLPPPPRVDYKLLIEP